MSLKKRGKIQLRNKCIFVGKRHGLAPSIKFCDDHDVGGWAVWKMRREMDMTLSKCQVLLKLALLTDFLTTHTHTVLVSMTSRVF
jgi:hypothetical protein